METLKLKQLKLKNFGSFTDFECQFNNEVTHLVGVNGAGKTTVGLTAIWACLKGIAEKNSNGQLIGERFRFIGKSKASADIELTVFDEKTQSRVTIKNHITKDSNKITCEPVMNSAWLQDLISVAFVSTKYFTSLNSREQALELGIDTSSIDADIDKIKSEITIQGRLLRGLGNIEKIDKVDEVNLESVLAERDAIEAFNKMQREINFEMKEILHKMEDAKSTIAELELEIKELEKRIKDRKDKISGLEIYLSDYEISLSKMTNPQPEKDLSVVNSKINKTCEINEQARQYAEYVKKEQNKKEIEDKINSLKEEKQGKETERINLIKSFETGFEGLSIDDSGGLLLQGKPIKEPYFSKGELELIVAGLHVAKDTNLKFRFIDDFDLLDTDNQTKILDSLLESGFQVVTAQVGDKPGSNVLLLKECEVVDEYSASKPKLF